MRKKEIVTEIKALRDNFRIRGTVKDKAGGNYETQSATSKSGQSKSLMITNNKRNNPMN